MPKSSQTVFLVEWQRWSGNNRTVSVHWTEDGAKRQIDEIECPDHLTRYRCVEREVFP